MISPNDSLEEKRTCWIVDFAVSADYGVKLKEREKYLDLAGELKTYGIRRWR